MIKIPIIYENVASLLCIECYEGIVGTWISFVDFNRKYECINGHVHQTANRIQDMKPFND